MKKGILSMMVICVFSLITIQGTAQSFLKKSNGLQEINLVSTNPIKLNQYEFKMDVILASDTYNNSNLTLSNLSSQSHLLSKNYIFNYENENFSEAKSLNYNSLVYLNQNNSEMETTFINSDWYNKSRRNIYSGIWTYASLNYLYCDLAAFMDSDMHLQYHTGTVDGFEMTPGFIAASAVMMQIALTNVFLPQIIKNDKTLRWVQIASGTLMTLVQSATLFADKPTAYYAVFSGFEIAATAYITFDAIRWKPKKTTDNY